MRGFFSSEARKTAPLLSANIVCGLIGLIQTVIIARLCGPEPMGLAAGLMSLAPLVVNLIDIRLADLTAACISTADISQKGAIIRQGATAQIILTAVVALIAIPATWFIAPWVTDHRYISTLTLILAPLVAALLYISNFFSALHRIILNSHDLISAQIVTVLVTALITIGIVFLSPDVEALILGAFLSAVFALIINVHFIRRALPNISTSNTLGGALSGAWKFVVDNKTFLIAGNLYGYTKTIHRGADILLVSLLCSAQVTGLYKFARSLTDNGALVVDALQKQYFSKLLSSSRACASSSDPSIIAESQRYLIKFARNSSRWGIISWAIIFVLELIFLAPIITRIFGTAFVPAVPAILIFTIPIFLNGTVNLWLWPWSVGTGQLGFYSKGAFIGALLGQYGVSLSLWTLFQQITPNQEMNSLLAFSIGHAIVYPIHYGIVARHFFLTNTERANDSTTEIIKAPQ